MFISDNLAEEYSSIYSSRGGEKLYRYIIGKGIILSSEIAYPELILLDQSEKFFILYRKTGDVKNFEIATILRRAAHKIYREFARMYKRNDLDYPINNRFLNIIRN
jgi:hypothetical protein